LLSDAENALSPKSPELALAVIWRLPNGEGDNFRWTGVSLHHERGGL